MGRKIWFHKRKHLWIQPSFYLLATTLLTLLLPLSVLLVARFSTSYSLLTVGRHPITRASSLSSIVNSILIETNPCLLCAIVYLIATATLFQCLTGRTLVMTEPPEANYRPNLCISGTLLCTLLLCIGLGIEAIIAARIHGDGFGHERNLSGGVVFVFLLGLHETTLYWWRVVVKPAIDEMVFGFVREERWVERGVRGCGFAALWWWKLRDEVESLADMVEFQSEMPAGFRIARIVGWWLHYLITAIGMVKIVKGIAACVGDPDDDGEDEDLEEV